MASQQKDQDRADLKAMEPNRYAIAEKVLDSHGIEYVLQTMRVDDLVIAEDTQVRNGRNRHDKMFVRAYVTKTRAGSPPPAIVVYGKELLDGFHRVETHKEIGLGTIPAYVITSEIALELRRQLAAELNDHGKPLSSDERLEVAAEAYLTGTPMVIVEERYGVPRNAIEKVVNLGKFKGRTDRLGIHPERLTQSSKLNLLKVALDEPFKAAVQLCDDRNLSAGDVKELVSKVSEGTTMEEQLAVIAATKAAIDAKAVARPVRKIETCIAKIDAFCDVIKDKDPSDFVNPLDRDRNIANLDLAIAKLLAIRSLYTPASGADVG